MFYLSKKYVPTHFRCKIHLKHIKEIAVNHLVSRQMGYKTVYKIELILQSNPMSCHYKGTRTRAASETTGEASGALLATIYCYKNNVSSAVPHNARNKLARAALTGRG